MKRRISYGEKINQLIILASLVTLTACGCGAKLTTPEEIDASMQEKGYTLKAISTAVSGNNDNLESCT